MDFIGSKAKWNDWIFSKIKKRINIHEYTFIDGCSGSGTTAQFALSQGMNVIANDLLQFSGTIIKGSVYSDLNELTNHINVINNLPGKKGFFYNNFTKVGNRLYFTEENGKKIDACREYISNLENEQLKNNLLYFAVEALSRISNTTGVHGAFLKKIKKRAIAPFQLKIEKLIKTDKQILTYSEDIVKLVEKLNYIAKSILYIDPPYTYRQYPPNYHLYETFIRNDNPKLKGLTGLRNNWIAESKSDLCNKHKFLSELRDILRKTNSSFVYLSYSSDGIATKKEIYKLLSSCGNVKFYKKVTKRYKSDSNRTNNQSKLYEWLFECKVYNSRDRVTP